MSRMGMRCHQEVDLVYIQGSQAGYWTAPTRVYKRSLTFRGPDEYGVSLSHIEECDPDRFIDLGRGRDPAAHEGNKKNSRVENARKPHSLSSQSQGDRTATDQSCVLDHAMCEFFAKESVNKAWENRRPIRMCSLPGDNVNYFPPGRAGMSLEKVADPDLSFPSA